MHLTQILCLFLLNKFFDSKKTQLLPAKENKKKSFGYVKNKRRKKMQFLSTLSQKMRKMR